MSARTTISATVFNDPGCPWGYSAVPALRVLEWRYGSQIDWRLVMIGLAEDPQLYIDRGYTPAMAKGNVMFRDRWHMPLVPAPKTRMAATSPGCRIVVAAGIDHPGSEWAVLRELQFVQFTDAGVLMDDPDLIVRAVQAGGRLDGIDIAALAARIEDADVRAAYEEQRAETRTAEGTPGAMQGKTFNSDGAERYTAPSVIFRQGDVALEAAGMQPVEAYDVLIANLDPTLERTPAPDHVVDALRAFPDGLTTAEVAAIRTSGNDAIDYARAERELVELVADGGARRVPLGNDALWFAS
jgi:2-hydroxychromene-2-carboxylate isomerase